MKSQTLSVPLLVLSCFILFSCHPKIYPVFKEQQKLHYSFSWEKLESYPLRTGRNDDLHFFTPERGFTINSQGHLLLTEDGGQSWETKFRKKSTFFRCLTFKDSMNGWLGTIGTGDKALRSVDTVALYETRDGGETWTPAPFEGPYPKGLCGLQKVSDEVIVGCGRVRGPSFFIKTTDGGKTWQSYDLNHLAGSLIAPYFYDEQHGILIGGTTTDKIKCRSLVLETFDGGTTWDTIYISSQKGEYTWKVSFPTDNLGFISIQRNVKDGRFYYLQTNDGGKNWFENVYIDEPYYVQGVGFINEKVGWLGGSPKWTMETRDGGKTWKAMKDVGRGFNNFQFFGDSLAYGVGYGVYKMNQLKPLPDSLVSDFYDNGHPKSMLFYKKGRQNGQAKHFYKSQKLRSQGVIHNNLQHGKWRFYSEEDNYVKILKYKNGVAKISKKQLKDFTGTYQVREGVFRTITYEKGKLYSNLSGQEKVYEIIPVSDAEFVYDFNWHNRVEFVKDEAGNVTHHIMKTRSNESKADKID